MQKLKFQNILQIFSLRSRIIMVYVIILGVGGLITSFIGAIIVNRTIMSQARSKVHHDLKTANMVFTQQLNLIKRTINLGVSSNALSKALTSGDENSLDQISEQIFSASEVDFLTIIDTDGNIVYRKRSFYRQDNAKWNAVILKALEGQSVASPVVFPREKLQLENPELLDKILSEDDGATEKSMNEDNCALVLMAASPIFAGEQGVIGVIYGGKLMNCNFSLVDQIWKTVYEGEQFEGKEIGAVSLICNSRIVSTTLRRLNEDRAIGTFLPEDARKAIFESRQPLALTTNLLGKKYISEFQPILNITGKIIGALQVGVLEKAYISIRNQVIQTFMAVASIGFFLIIFISYLITSSITRPLSEIVKVTDAVASGNLNNYIKIQSKDEIGQLAHSFNRMISSLRRMKRELEEWGNTLEQKVKQRTEELAAMQRTLMQSQRLASLGKLAAGIAHEINNPLGGILVLSSLVLEDMPENDSNRENLQEVIKQTMRCRDIVKGLLQFSRQEQGKTEYVNLNEVLQNTLALIEKQALFHNIKVVKKLQQDIPFITGDNSRLQQVFMNVIMNAVQAMGEVGKLTLKTYHDRKNDMVVTEIEDTGCGIPEENIDRIFDPFFTTKEAGEGTGLGLAIAYGIVAKHNGRMSVKSKVGEGSNFIIKIPAAEIATINDKKDEIKKQ